jgi:hypothetical protein
MLFTVLVIRYYLSMHRTLYLINYNTVSVDLFLKSVITVLISILLILLFFQKDLSYPTKISWRETNL